jgi:hypothetical protein
VLIALYLPTVRTKHSNPSEYFFIFLNLKIMFKSLNLNYIHIYIVAVFLAVGCAKESLSPDQTDAILAMAHTDNPEGPDPDPEVDCKCYMRVTGAENAAPGIWSLLDVTGNPTFPVEFQGTGNNWIPPTQPPQQFPLPSSFQELVPPSNGWHTFELWFFFGAPEGFKLHTEVRCFLQNGDGSQTLLTTTYHTFDFYGDGAEAPPADPTELRRFVKFFSCLVQTDDPPKDTGGS